MPARRVLSAFAALLAVPLALSACSAAAPADEARADTVTVESAYGDVQVPKDPQRIAGISYDTPWQLMSLDVTPVAAIDYSRWIDEYTKEQQEFIAKTTPVGTFGEVNFEALATTKPDLIIGDAGEVDESTYKRLSQIAPTVIVGGDSRGDWTEITRQVATAVNRLDVWEAAKVTYEKRRDEVKAEYADVISKNRWASFSFGDEAGQFSIQLPTGSTGNLIVNEMGLTYGDAVPTKDETGAGYVSLPLERVGEVFTGVTAALTFAGSDGKIHAGIQEIIDTPLFQSLEVTKSGHIFGMVTSVTDYASATKWIDELVEKVLKPLS